MIRYTIQYKSFPDCPAATEYSKDAAEIQHMNGSLSFVALIGGGIAYIYSIFNLISKGDWITFISSVLFITVSIFWFMYAYLVSPVKTDRKIGLILLKHSYPDATPEQIKEVENKWIAEDYIKLREKTTIFLKTSLKVILCITAASILLATISFLNDSSAVAASDFEASSEVITQTEPPLTPVGRPLSGRILSGSQVTDGSELTITAPSNSDCVVKLKTPSGLTKLMFYVRAGATTTVKVPMQSLYVYFAYGETWYGTDHLFGKETHYSKDNDPLDFSQYTWKYTLQPVTDGNFSDTPIDPSEF